MKQLLKLRDTFAVLFAIAMAESIGVFLFVCGFMHVTISEIGRIASVGYVIGMAGVFFSIMMLFYFKKEFECER